MSYMPVTCALAGDAPGGGALKGGVALGEQVEDGAVVAHLRQNLRERYGHIGLLQLMCIEPVFHN